MGAGEHNGEHCGVRRRVFVKGAANKQSSEAARQGLCARRATQRKNNCIFLYQRIFSVNFVDQSHRDFSFVAASLLVNGRKFVGIVS